MRSALYRLRMDSGNGQGPGTGTSEGAEAAALAAAGGDAPTGTSTGGDAPVVSASDYAKLQAKVKELEDERFQQREAERERKKATEEAQRKAGEYEPLLAERDARLAELEAQFESLKPKAEAREAWETAEANRIKAEAEAAGLDEKAMRLLDNTALDDRRDLLSLLVTKPTKERPPEHPPASPAAGSPDPIDWTDAAAKGELDKVKAENPDAWNAFVSGSSSKKPTGNGLLARLVGGARS